MKSYEWSRPKLTSVVIHLKCQNKSWHWRVMVVIDSEKEGTRMTKKQGTRIEYGCPVTTTAFQCALWLMFVLLLQRIVRSVKLLACRRQRQYIYSLSLSLSLSLLYKNYCTRFHTVHQAPYSHFITSAAWAARQVN